MIPIFQESSRLQAARAAVQGLAIALLALAVTVEPASAKAPAESSSEVALDLEGNPRKHRKRQRRPVKMGTSGGNVTDITDTFCCSGTLGGLVRKRNELFILSNNHVIAVSNLGQAGDAVSQPGLTDNGCSAPNRNIIAELSGFKRLKFNRGKNLVDAALAAVVDGSVDESGAMIGMGVPGNQTLTPRLGLQVKKAGRTTGVTEGVVDAVNARARVFYTQECSDDAPVLEALFVKQFIVVSNTNKSFSGSGDSGSVILENVSSCPRQVGLLFAGNERITVGSKMSTVLKQAGKMDPRGPVDLVGCNPSVAAGTKLETRGGLAELDERALRLAERIQARADRAILALRGVTAMGIGRSSSRPGAPVFKVYLEEARADLVARIPLEIEGVPVEVVESGPIFASTCRRPVGTAD